MPYTPPVASSVQRMWTFAEYIEHLRHQLTKKISKDHRRLVEDLLKKTQPQSVDKAEPIGEP